MNHESWISWSELNRLFHGCIRKKLSNSDAKPAFYLKKLNYPKWTYQKRIKSNVEIKWDDPVKILSVDKGNTMVILDAKTYESKISDPLNADKYSFLKKAQLNTYNYKIVSTLFWKDKKYFFQQSLSLTLHHSITIYGLSKI